MNTILTAKTPLIPPVQKSGSISPYCANAGLVFSDGLKLKNELGV
jgi:hypothetical protein